MRRASFVLAAAALLAACTTKTSDQIVAEPTPTGRAADTSNAVAATTSAPSPTAPRPTTLPATPARITPAARPEDAPALGAACKDPETCGTRSRVAVRAYDVHGRASPPAGCELRTLRARGEARMGAGSGDLLRACVVGDRLVVRSECVICRLQRESILEVLVDEATGPQLAYARAFAHLPGELTTLDAWRSAIRAGSDPDDKR